MNQSTKLLRTILLVGLIVVGAILLYRIFAGGNTPDASEPPEVVLNEQAPAVVPVTGTWDYTVQSDQGPITGVLLFAGAGDNLTGSMANQNGTDPLRDIEYDPPNLTFSLPSDGGDTITFSTIVTGNTLAGTMNIPDMAPLQIRATKQQ